MRKNKVVLLILSISFTLIFALTGCQNKITSEDIKSKVIQEIDYLDTKIVTMLNLLNNVSVQEYTITSEEISLGNEGNKENTSNSGGQENNGESSSAKGEQSGTQQSNSKSQLGNNSNISVTQMKSQNILGSDENNIDWETIKNEIETINEAWAVVVIDLSSFNINSEDILNFSSTLDDCILSIKDENKVNTLKKLAELYTFIPIIERGIGTSNSRQNIKQVKSYIINSYSLLEQEDWEAIERNMSEAENIFNNITNDIEYIKEKEYKVNRSYVLIKELQNSLSYRNKKLFLLKYKNLMESVNVL